MDKNYFYEFECVIKEMRLHLMAILTFKKQGKNWVKKFFMKSTKKVVDAEHTSSQKEGGSGEKHVSKLLSLKTQSVKTPRCIWNLFFE